METRVNTVFMSVFDPAEELLEWLIVFKSLLLACLGQKMV